MKWRATKRLDILLRIVIVVVFARLIFSKVAPGSIVSAMAKIGLGQILILCIGSLALFGIRVLKWAILIRASGIPARLLDIVFSFSRGAAVGSVTPMQIGEFMRSTAIPEGYRGRCIALMVVDKALDMLALLALSLFSIGYYRDHLILGIFAAGTILVAAIKYRFVITSFLLKTLSRLSRSYPTTKTDSRILVWQWPTRTTMIALILSIFGYVVIATQYALLFFVINPGYDRSALLVCPLLILARAVPLTFSGLGIREGIAVSFLPRFGLSPEESVGTSLLMSVINLWVPLSLALISIIPGFSGKDAKMDRSK